MKLVAGCYLSTQCCNVRSVADRVFTVVVDSRDSSVQRPNRSDTQRKNLANQLLSVGCQVFSNHDSCAFEFSSLPDDSRFDVVAGQFHNYGTWSSRIICYPSDAMRPADSTTRDVKFELLFAEVHRHSFTVLILSFLNALHTDVVAPGVHF